MPPRRQRKRKTIQVKDPETFFADLEDIFENEIPADIFSELIHDYQFGRNFNDYLELFCERCFSGRYGLISGEKIPDAPLKTSFLGCELPELDMWVEEFGKLCQTFVTMRNKMDLILAKFLTSSNYLSDELKQRAFLIAAKIVQYKAYNRSYQSDFFLTALLNVLHGYEIIGGCLNALKECIGYQETFNFCKTFEFVSLLADYDCQTLFSAAPWFQQLCQQFELYRHEQELKDRLIELNLEENAEEFARQLQEFKHEAGEKYKSVLYSAIFRILEQMPKNNVAFEIESALAKIIGEIKSTIRSVRDQGEFMDYIYQNCHEIASLHDCFKPLVLLFYHQRIIDGKVIIAWYERAQGRGKLSFYTYIEQFYQWLKT